MHWLMRLWILLLIVGLLVPPPTRLSWADEPASPSSPKKASSLQRKAKKLSRVAFSDQRFKPRNLRPLRSRSKKQKRSRPRFQRVPLRWFADNPPAPPTTTPAPPRPSDTIVDPQSGATFTPPPPIAKPPLVPRSDENDPPMSIYDIYQIAKKENLDLKILRERIAQAEISRDKAWAILKPTVTVQGTYTRNQFEASLSTGSAFKPLLKLFDSFPIPPETKASLEKVANAEPSVIQALNQLSFNVVLNWGFFNLRSLPLLQIAYLSVDQVQQIGLQTRREILFATIRAYYGILLSDGLVDITRQSLQNAEERLRIAKARYQAGVAPLLTVTRAELDMAQARQSLIQAETSLQNTKLSLALLLNRRDLRFRPATPTSAPSIAGSETEWMEMARTHREEVKSSRIALQIAEKSLLDGWMQYFPTVALQGLLRGGNTQSIGTDQNTQWSISVVASWNIYDGGNRYGQIKEFESKARQARLEIAKAERQVENEVSQAILQLKNTRVAIQVARQQVSLAEQNYNLTQERYKTGVATPVEVSDADANLNSARISLLRERLNLELAILSLRRAIGLFDPRTALKK